MSNIKNLETMLHLEDLVVQADNDTLVLFDVGGVLLNAGEALFQADVKPIRERLHAEYLAPLGQERQAYLWSLILRKGWKQLVEVQTPQVIKRLQDKGVQVMALTALQTGKMGTIESMEDWRLASVVEHGINFTQMVPNQDHFVLDELVKDGFSPVYKRGALFTHKHSKGQVLTAFLKRINWMPERIVFVDDSRSQLEDVAVASEKLSIPYTGAHYNVVRQKNKPFDEALARARFRHLVEHAEWLDEIEAQSLVDLR